MLIPKIIHQTTRFPQEIDSILSRNIETIKNINRNWEHRLYDNNEIVEYIGKHLGSDVVRLCHAINPRYGVVLADLFRYLVVYQEGGVYLDIKTAVSQPLDHIVQSEDVFILSQWRSRLGDRYAGWGLYPELKGIPGGEFQQWHIMGAPGHPFLARVIENTLCNMRHYSVARHGLGKIGILRVSGPICYSLAIAPLLAFCRYRLVDIESLGVHYTIYQDPKFHMVDAGHYSHFNEPVMLSE